MSSLFHTRAIAVTTAVFLLTTAVAVGLAFAGSDLLVDRRVSVPLLLVLLASGAIALLGWASERTRRDELELEHADEVGRLGAELSSRERELREEADQAAAALETAREELERREEQERLLTARLEGVEKALAETSAEYEKRLDEADERAREERRRRERSEESRREEREWALHLRGQVMQLQQERGALGDMRDVRALVLRTAITLTGAQKGLLLSRIDSDNDELLDLVAHEGFAHEPSDSAVAQRFAREVIAKDVTVREDADSLAALRRTPADDEIQTLLAVPIYIADRFQGVVVLANRPGGFDEKSDDVLLALGAHAGAVLHNARLRDELRSAYVATVHVLADAIEAKDRMLGGHSKDVARLVVSIADRLGLEARRREDLVYATLLHDVGKLGISERILAKPAALTPEERSIVELHPRIGYRLVQEVPALGDSALAVLHHHERWDGSGYPDGLAGEDIPVEARIVAVADAFGAMTSDRPYRRRLPVEDACAELESGAGTQFDPAVVRLFVDAVRSQPAETETDVLHEALADPAVVARRDSADPVLGAGVLGLTDSLTLLPTLRRLHETAAAEARRAETGAHRFAVLLVALADIDRVNERGGYAAGDEAIRRAARAAQRVAARAGGIAFRHGGARLALLLPGDASAAEAAGGELETELGGTYELRRGAAGWRPGDAGDDVIARAREALDSGEREHEPELEPVLEPEPPPQAPGYPGFIRP